MKRRSTQSGLPKFALCIENAGNPASLEVFKVYRVVTPRGGDDPKDIRIIDESGEDYLYPRENFVPIRMPAKALERAMAGR